MASNPNRMPSVKIEQITPAMADKYLSTMTRNRKLRDSAVVRFCHIIERGEWRLTTDAIGFDSNGHLINGQHRLTACGQWQDAHVPGGPQPQVGDTGHP